MLNAERQREKKTTATTKKTPMAAATTISQDITPDDYKLVTEFFDNLGINLRMIKPEYNVKDSFSNVVGGALEVISIERGKISCLLNVKPPILNGHGLLLGGVVAAVAERVAIACARTIVGNEKDLFLGELTISYLSSAQRDAEVLVDGSVIRSGRNLTVVAVDFRLKETGRLAYMSRSTFYNMPVSSL